MVRHLAIEPAPHQVREFEDGEHTIRPLTDVEAARVTVVTMYLACGRKDRRTRRREPLNTRYTACPFEAVGK